MVTIKREIITQNPLVRRLLYITGIRRPMVPHGVGMTYYQKNSAWDLGKDGCSCDLELVEYLKESKIEDKSIFHFGTGIHHIVGLENQKLDRPNEILGITASAIEHQAYIQLVFKDTSLAKYYKVIFVDIYTLTDKILPKLDIATLFHLCEFYLPENAPMIHQNDESLLQLVIEKLHPDGKIIFYTGSFTWSKAQPIVQACEASGKIKQIDRYKSLLIYAKLP
ncbi:MAG: hypothetical protein RMX68_004825 [Aulosira sp. ZfuVER01]|nr:hypothetical protein [Aulosira sp. ZfuVER01]MDZ8000722.1 hypothetical protein [Aulosira sp. DedVER01a]MDZ8051837.1 hypothetical protein [Aulosira sp. ZfuCHP01]